MVKKRKDLIFLMFLFGILFMLLPIISAPKPGVTSIFQQSGLDISYPNPYYLKTDQPFYVRFWVYNSTETTIMTNRSVNCTYNLIDSNGLNLIKISSNQSPTSEIKFGLPPPGCAYCFNFNLSKTFFNHSGIYSYQIRCQGLGIGGYLSDNYEVSVGGQELSEGRAVLDIGFMVLMLFFFSFTIFLFIRYENLALRVGMFGLSYILLIIIIYSGWRIAASYMTIVPFFTAMLRWFFIILMISALPLLIFAFVYYLFAFRKVKELRRLMDKGFSWEEANRRTKHG